MGLDTILAGIGVRAGGGGVSVNGEGREEMEEEAITLAEVFEAIRVGQIIEHYPDHRRGSCCLLYGQTTGRRPLHVVCTTELLQLVIITVYVPAPPKWVSPTERRAR